MYTNASSVRFVQPVGCQPEGFPYMYRQWIHLCKTPEVSSCGRTLSCVYAS